MTPQPLVVDTSVVVKWFLDEPHASQALDVRRAIQQGAYRPVVPDLVYAEFANTIWKHVRRYGLDPSDGEVMIASFLALPMDVVPSHAILLPAFRIACATGRPVYDALFLALSQEAGADMVTADEQLYEAVRAHFPRLQRLAAWGA
ncbi:MAG: type II toxin-antitoxin system VapC family toxin [Armatimonadota bacterium]|nr:type II toxin-antitoxin system VapC family toxin [Armatimonadota bacterium]MDR7533385.1 type II toxin-antitoxin system VapC family toxin [Armatimonadota bacterium]MDR7536505.1 type II toxin-antitoxin system VapC family toxin [Armatimonadota bacterium]